MTTDDFALMLLAMSAVVCVVGVLLIRVAIRRRDAENDDLNEQLERDR